MVTSCEFKKGTKSMETMRILQSIKHRINYRKSCRIELFPFLSLLTNRWWGLFLTSREILLLDEAHRLEEEVIKFTGISISKRRWNRYIPNFNMADYGYTDIEKWIGFLIDLEAKIFVLIGNEDGVEKLAIFRRRRYNWTSKIDSFNKTKIGEASDIFEGDEKNDELIYTRSPLSEELTVDAMRDTEKLTDAINNILSNPRNWIISDI